MTKLNIIWLNLTRPVEPASSGCEWIPFRKEDRGWWHWQIVPARPRRKYTRKPADPELLTEADLREINLKHGSAQ